MAMTAPTRYWHGGKPDLRVGDLIRPGQEPRVVAGCKICESRAHGHTITVDGYVVDAPAQHTDRVYITTDREYAKFYASMAWLGDLYQVKPVGDVVPSTEDHPEFGTWTAPAAKVVAVIERAVRLSDKQRRHLDNRWARYDADARFRSPRP